MSNVTVQEALKVAIESIENYGEFLSSVGVLIDTHKSTKTVELCKAALAEIDKCEPVADALRFLKSHNCVDDEGYEYGICKVKFDSSGKAAEVLWSDIDAVIKLKTKKGIV